MPAEEWFQVRRIFEDQWEQWREVRLAALAESPSAFESTHEQWKSAPESRWRARLSSVDLNLIAEDRGPDTSPLGIASGIRNADGSSAELISMWVAPRARSTGVTDALIEGVIAWARQCVSVLGLAVTPGNDRAIAVYLRHGFELSEKLGETTAGGYGRELLMVKTLR